MRQAGRRGQSVTDYAIAVGAIAVTMGVMQPFLQRMVQARIKDTADGLFATEASDAPDFSGAITNHERNQWGMEVQREGMDRRKANTGIGNGDTVADFTTSVHVDLDEGMNAGRYGVTFANNVRDTSGRAHFKGTRLAPAQTPIKPGIWFKTEAQKEAAAEAWQKVQEWKRARRHRQKEREQAWDDTKEAARQCYADPACREIFTDRQKYRQFARRWNKGLGNTPKQRQQNPLYLDPEADPAEAFERWYGVPLADGESGWNGETYAGTPDWFDRSGPRGKKHKDEREALARRQPIIRRVPIPPTYFLPAANSGGGQGG